MMPPAVATPVIGVPSASAAANAWPKGMDPAHTPVYARNELAIAAPPARVFKWLVRAGAWPSYYDNAKDVSITSPTGPDLVSGARFHWKTFGIPLDTQVTLYEPNRALGWDARMLGLRAYHRWFIVPVGQGCQVITEETDGGVVSWLAAGTIRQGLLREHQHWLEGLRHMALQGDPPRVSKP